ncbi:xanthine dehydrogenase small subunit [Sphingomonas sp. CFBP 13603]|uniref:xanthine dehydrogenase small subunit n=1 Tax=Sphingomonas sp. CFBP 13603 TaxID=2774040 RepID=UPI0018671B03|nr:xanthine dehydrogenase small subunit [Sphingomonas sp. CFBP 13603]MBE2992240.1 xanthine dehydrogenase small subunit [Sphingomonas sp. CFBP 13603]
MTVRFLLDDAVVELAEVDPTATLLDHLRYRMRRTGTKEGCAEGDCGACTVLVGELDSTERAVTWRAVNACILFLPMLHGKALLTVESLAQDGVLTPLQTCMAENGSSQCGFCTPGFVMSLHGRSIGATGHMLPVADVIAGNLCRCTGYGPILAAGEIVAPFPRDDAPLVAKLKALAETNTVAGRLGDRRWFIPRTATALADLLAQYPDARIVAGATDIGLWVTKGLQTINTLIFVGDIAELARIDETPDGLTLGAAVRYADAHDAFARLHPDLGELVRRLGGLQVRNAGTIGGNIANGSPIGDGPPAFIALGATLTVRGIDGRRTMPLEDYFIAYGKQDLRPGEFVESLHIPRPGPGDVIHISKLSRRFDSDITAVCGAFNATVHDDRIAHARVAFGGMAATPKRAVKCEAALIDQPFTLATMQAAMDALRTDYAPLTDVRGSAVYRIDAAANLLLRLWYKAQGETVFVLDLEPAGG